ncbi:MAG TPA: polysaccharide deacetylase family protein [Halanaerobiales bacterium]|nr:polysaccharide deacetylase family protein [Halanaerobiales bacterium]HPZ62583.1 polysaccharide deacetylase family protein [Halanaerobiales bacterium]HQD03121.1 polysaccharide deacetylase family protein [Halanaerobiales bacterium]
MKIILSPGKKFIFFFILTILLVVFAFGFIMGNKYGEAIPVLNQRLVPIYKVARDDKRIAITLDGTWGADYTEEILQILRENDVKITFFFAGYWLEKYPDILKKIAAEGHEIGNHSYTHPHFNQLSKEKIKEELESTSDLIEKLIGKRPVYFRPPFGEYNNNVIKTVTELGYQVIQWSIDSLDWMEPGVDKIVERVLQAESGDIILMHNNAPETSAALRRIIPIFKERGYEIVPLSELVYKDNYYIESHSGRQVSHGHRGEG